MKIKETKVSFLKSVFIGSRAFMITVSKDGFEADLEEISNECSAYNVCEIKGDKDTNPFYYKEDIANFCKTLKKNNPYVKIIIHSDGLIQPTGLNSVTDLTYVVHCKLKRTGIDYKLRVNENSWKWISKQDSLFVFDIDNDEELDEINLLLLDTGINKNGIYIRPYTNNDEELERLFYLVMHNGFNIYVEYGGEWFGRDKQEN